MAFLHSTEDLQNLCRLLNVKDNEEFNLLDFDEDFSKIKWRINERGGLDYSTTSVIPVTPYWMDWFPASANAYIYCISHPEKIKLRKRHPWTKADYDDAVAINRIFGNNYMVARIKGMNNKYEKTLNYSDGEFFITLSDQSFPSLDYGEKVKIKDILNTKELI